VSNSLSGAAGGSYVRRIDGGGKANRVLGQDFELDANQVASHKSFEVSAVELDARSLDDRPRQ
jgi:hypothetical protein